MEVKHLFCHGVYFLLEALILLKKKRGREIIKAEKKKKKKKARELEGKQNKKEVGEF